MKVLLLQLDGELPNLALLRAAAWYRGRGDDVTLRVAGNAHAVQRRLGDAEPDQVLASAIFKRTRPVAEAVRAAYPGAIVGGTGWDPAVRLSDIGIEERGPLDYTDHPNWTASVGFTQRGCRLKCPFCVVPRKEGAVRAEKTIREIWRGDPWPRHILLLDNDFLGQPAWTERVEELNAGKYRVCLTQGINARTLTPEGAAGLASLDYRDSRFRERRLYTAFDHPGDRGRVLRGLELLAAAGVTPRQIVVYMLIGYWKESLGEADRRRRDIRAFGALPYPMPYKRDRELVGYQRWVVGAYDKGIPWEEWRRAGYRPERLERRKTEQPRQGALRLDAA